MTPRGGDYETNDSEGLWTSWWGQQSLGDSKSEPRSWQELQAEQGGFADGPETSRMICSPDILRCSLQLQTPPSVPANSPAPHWGTAEALPKDKTSFAQH